MAGMDARTSGEHEKTQVYYYQQNDVSMLRLFEAFLESAPQLTLQLYIMVATHDSSWLTGRLMGATPNECLTSFKPASINFYSQSLFGIQFISQAVYLLSLTTLKIEYHVLVLVL